MTCSHIKIGDTYAIICHGRPSARKCACGSGKPADKLCDFPTANKTCDRKMCSKCASSGGPNIDYCRDHAAALHQAALL